MPTIDDDLRFAAELKARWDLRSATVNRKLAGRWLERAIRSLLVDILRREGLTSEANRLADLPHLDADGGSAAASTALFDIAAQIEAQRPTSKSVDTAILVLAARSAIDAYVVEHPALLDVLCLRLRQLARAARRLDDESDRMTVDLADA